MCLNLASPSCISQKPLSKATTLGYNVDVYLVAPVKDASVEHVAVVTVCACVSWEKILLEGMGLPVPQKLCCI